MTYQWYNFVNSASSSLIRLPNERKILVKFHCLRRFLSRASVNQNRIVKIIAELSNRTSNHVRVDKSTFRMVQIFILERRNGIDPSRTSGKLATYLLHPPDSYVEKMKKIIANQLL